MHYSTTQIYIRDASCTPFITLRAEQRAVQDNWIRLNLNLCAPGNFAGLQQNVSNNNFVLLRCTSQTMLTYWWDDKKLYTCMAAVTFMDHSWFPGWHLAARHSPDSCYSSMFHYALHYCCNLFSNKSAPGELLWISRYFLYSVGVLF